jgi:hypothetical protein
MNPRHLAAIALLSGCGVSTAHLGGSEDDELGSSEHLLKAQLEQHFGPGARIQRMFSTQLIGVTTEPVTPDSDVVPSIALARVDADKVTPVETAQRFREGLVVGADTATVDDEGLLTLAGRQLAVGVRGDVCATPDARALLFTKEPANAEAPTTVAVADVDGASRTLADDGDRPSVSPDGKTVVFVSARTGVASLYRTTLAGGEAVQLTNKGLETLTRAEGDESDPAGFVPVPVAHDRLSWRDATHVRFDAGGGEYWVVDVTDGSAVKEVTP